MLIRLSQPTATIYLFLFITIYLLNHPAICQWDVVYGVCFCLTYHQWRCWYVSPNQQQQYICFYSSQYTYLIILPFINRMLYMVYVSVWHIISVDVDTSVPTNSNNISVSIHLNIRQITNQLFQNIFKNSFRVSNSLDPDQGRHCVGPDLGPNCLQRLSASDKNCLLQKNSNAMGWHVTYVTWT